MSREHSEEETEFIHHLKWERSHYLLEGERFIPCVYEGVEALPEGFNTIVIRLDGQLESAMDWTKPLQEAEATPHKILWKLDLGLFSRLKFPLENEMQFQSLGIALTHFRDHIWPRVAQKSLGVVLYEGGIDFTRGFPGEIDWSATKAAQQNACAAACVEYLGMLQDFLSDLIPVFVMLDAYHILDEVQQLRLLNPERWHRFHVILRHTHLPLGQMAWEGDGASGFVSLFARKTPPYLAPSIGLCIPSGDHFAADCLQELQNGLKRLTESNQPYRLIAESFLTTEWDGIDYLLFSPAGLSPQGKRKLAGFCAAGGVPVSLGLNPLGLPGELSIEKWVEIDTYSSVLHDK